ncbi:hypothetical protein E5D57_012026 [Metarhizium anisopliae]|nr:hypothetical protein E5D57_012026 [Metarhizium anisopliae]
MSPRGRHSAIPTRTPQQQLDWERDAATHPIRFPDYTWENASTYQLQGDLLGRQAVKEADSN